MQFKVLVLVFCCCCCFTFLFFFFKNRMQLVLINLIFVTWTPSPIWQPPKTLQRLMTPHYINEAERIRISSPITEKHSLLGLEHDSYLTAYNMEEWGLGESRTQQFLQVKYWSHSKKLCFSTVDQWMDVFFPSLLGIPWLYEDTAQLKWRKILLR